MFSGAPTHAASSSKKPRSRSIFHSLFCCLCHDEAEQLPVNNNAPLLVEENGTVSKVRKILIVPMFFFVSTSFAPLFSCPSFTPTSYCWSRTRSRKYVRFTFLPLCPCVFVLFCFFFVSTSVAPLFSCPLLTPTSHCWSRKTEHGLEST